MKLKAPKCQYCNNRSELVTGATIYPERPNYREKLFWLCRPCDAYVGCHENGKTPFGTLANPELRKARMRAHAAFDILWKTNQMRRSEAYRWLSKELGIRHKKCHISWLSLEDCLKVPLVVSRTQSHPQK